MDVITSVFFGIRVDSEFGELLGTMVSLLAINDFACAEVKSVAGTRAAVRDELSIPKMVSLALKEA